VDKIIEALYFGNVNPAEHKSSSKERELMGYVARHKEALCQKLDAEGQITLEKLATAFTELMTEREIDIFKQGFKLGMCFAIEGTDIETQ